MKVLIVGFDGRMGQAIYNKLSNAKGFEVSEGHIFENNIPAFQEKYKDVRFISDISDSKDCDIVVDFSHYSLTSKILDFCVENKKALVLGTTSLTEELEDKVSKCAKFIPIFKSSNMSTGVFVMLNLIKQATKMLDGWDIEIVEKHHNAKKDAPSGTAYMMLKEVTDVRNDAELVFGRSHESGVRSKQEIGVHSVRGGGVAGEHEIGFYCGGEVLKITHEAFSREIFADGAVKATIFLSGKKAGYYSMKDLFDI